MNVNILWKIYNQTETVINGVHISKYDTYNWYHNIIALKIKSVSNNFIPFMIQRNFCCCNLTICIVWSGTMINNLTQMLFVNGSNLSTSNNNTPRPKLTPIWVFSYLHYSALELN